MTARTQNLTRSGLFIALGVLFPIVFHAVGMGSIFLPMFWPVAISAFFLPIPHALAVGVLTPILSTMVTGMPPPPTLYKMIFELAFLAGFTSLLYHKTRYGIFWLILGGVFMAEVAALISAAAIAPILGLPPEFYAVASLLKSVPGMILILVLIPLILKKIKNEILFGLRDRHV